MITVDLHSHTLHSHAKDTTAAMCEAALKKGMTIFGCSEHSLRPVGFNYPLDYQKHLKLGFPSYITEVQEEQRRYCGHMNVLLALEMDYIPSELAFAQKTCTSYPYDYIIGGLHFLGGWGFDYSAADWDRLSLETCFQHFSQYYKSLKAMAHTELFQIAAHPDLVKLFRPDAFRQWLGRDDARTLIHSAFVAIKETGMAIELSSAGLRKGLHEPYPGPVLMEMASALNLPITFGSDSHALSHVAYGFEKLAAYALRFGYTESVWFSQRVMQRTSFV